MAELDHADYTLQQGMNESLISYDVMQSQAWKQDEFSSMKVKELYDFVVSTFPGEEELK